MPNGAADADIQKVRTARAALFRQWSEVAAGQTLALTFMQPAG